MKTILLLTFILVITMIGVSAQTSATKPSKGHIVRWTTRVNGYVPGTVQKDVVYLYEICGPFRILQIESPNRGEFRLEEDVQYVITTPDTTATVTRHGSKPETYKIAGSWISDISCR